MSRFFDRLTNRARVANSLLCIGLDPHKPELDEDSAEGAYRFCSKLIKSTEGVAAAYKPNVAFFEAYGSAGCSALERVLELIPKDIPVILDAKRGDIGSTAEAYARGVFETLKCDAVTASPYMGGDSLQPFLKDPAKAVFVLCKTSNPGSNDLQTMQLANETPLYLHVAKLCCESWAKQYNNAGLVVGATDVEALRQVRKALPDVWFLSPGVGAQGGDMVEALSAGLRKDGFGILLPVSRGISKAENPQAMAEKLRDEINVQRAKFVQ